MICRRRLSTWPLLRSNRAQNAHQLLDGSPPRRSDIFKGPSCDDVLSLDVATIALSLKACNGNLGLGRKLHAFSVTSGLAASSVTVSNSLMNLYFRAGHSASALHIFHRLDRPDIVSWNTLLSASNDCLSAFPVATRMHRQGVKFDAVSYTKLLSYCYDLQGFLFGLQLHCLLLKCGFHCEVFVANALIALYARQGLLVEAKILFDEMPVRDLVSWGSIISGYTQEGSYGSESISLFTRMLREGVWPDHVSLTGALSACSQEGSFELGRQIHGFSVKIGQGKHTSVCNILMAIYSKTQATEDVKLIFRHMLGHNVISWTTMITADEEEAVSLFNNMRRAGVQPNDVTFIGLLHSITNRNLTLEGRMVHGYCIRTGFTSELNVLNCLITMYAKLKEMENAKRIFEEAPCREIVSWNALISGYAQNGMCQEALEIYFSAVAESYQPNSYTFGSILSAIGSAESISLRQGQKCHSHLVKLGLDSDSIVSGSLLDMYAKRGSISESLSVFSQTSRRSQFAWTAIISAHARHGDYDSAVELFEEMKEEGVKPDSVTYLSVLTACGRKGMVDVGRDIFKTMMADHSIEPSHEHYSCMVDMLGRAGLLNEAEELMHQTPGGPRLSALQSLLGACRMHGNIGMAERVMAVLMEIEPMESGSYVLMSNLYAEKGLWEKVAKMRKGMREKGVVKEIGFSWVDDGSLSLHGFSSGDMSHPQSDEIFSMAHCLGLEMHLLRVTEGETIGNIIDSTTRREENLVLSL